MNHDDFIKKYTGKFYDFDKLYGFECVDILHGYNRDVLGKASNVGLGAARNYYKESAKWGGIKTPQPVQGDFAFTDITEWGHVGIFERIDENPLYFWQFDQLGNGSKVGGEIPCGMRRYPISKLLGYVTYNMPPMEEPKMPLDELKKIWEDCKTRRFNDYSVDERTKILIDISAKK